MNKFELGIWQFALLVSFTLLFAGAVQARESLYDKQWGDKEVEERIERETRANRMGFATLRFVDEKGEPLTGVEVRIVQQSHDFLFGANIFMLGGFAEPAKNQEYERIFKRLFNYASAPFYWSDLEPEPGKVRFAKDSPPIYRRPPPDAVLEFTEANNITVKGHPLIWDKWYPAWLPKDEREVTRLMRARFEQISARYKNKIFIWDVVNESLKRNPDVVLPKDYVFTAFKQAERDFPIDTKLLINDVTSESWFNFRHETTPYFLLVENLIQRGARVDGIGFQCHFFDETEYADVLAGSLMQPRELFRVLDQFGELKRPLHITEITIPTLPNTAEGEADQAAVTRNFYRLWFSHKNVEAITWWNAVDNTAIKGEDKWRGGFLRQDMTPKPAFKILDELINKEWRTNLDLKIDEESNAKFQGFYGNYLITAKHNGKTATTNIHLSKTGTNDFTVKF